MSLQDINIKKTFGKDFKKTHQSKRALTFDHVPTKIHVSVFRRPRHYSICVFKGLTQTCTKARTVEDVVRKIKKIDLVKAVAWP